MNIERELESTIEKYKGKEVATFETRIDLMAEDCLREIRRLKEENAMLKVVSTSAADENAALRQSFEWIPASNGLPANGAVVLMLFNNAKYPVVGYYSKTWDCVQTLTGGQYPKSILTHWQMLPALPETEM